MREQSFVCLPASPAPLEENGNVQQLVRFTILPSVKEDLLHPITLMTDFRQVL